MAVILVTGASGFVGQALGHLLNAQPDTSWRPVVRTLRTQQNAWPDAWPTPFIINLEHGDFSAALSGVDCVIHLAARVHMLNDQNSDPLAAYRRVNVDATLRLARQAAASGVSRFIYLSSIKVNGEATATALQPQPFAADTPPQPLDSYGVSKWEAEQGLAHIARETGLQVVIIRPPLVYGTQVKANFLQLMRWVRRGLPLPLARARNQRSMVYVGNLVDLIWRCTHHPRAAGQTFLVSDGQDMSTAQLIQNLARAMHQSARLWPCPLFVLAWGARLTGRQAALERLFGSLQVDIQATCQTLEWQPPFSVEAGMAATVAAMLAAT